MALRAAEIESLFTADISQIVKAEKTIKDTGQRIEKKPIKVDADAKPALEGMDRVEQAAKKLVSKDVVATVDANIERGEKSLDRVQKRLDYLRSVSTDLDVTADINRAEASLSKVKRNLDGLKSARATMEVDADTSAADSALEGVKDTAGDAGEDSGKGFGDSIIAALVSIPIAGAVVGIAAAAAKGLVDAFNDGLQIEVGYDRLQALTGIDEAAAQRLGNAAGEAYANNFGDSIESNMDATRLALQFQILDPSATTRDAQLVVQGLSGIADVLGEDVEPVARAVVQMLRTGLAGSAREAFDILATGAREGVNIGEDLLDTFTEYGTQFRKLGIDGPQALGLLSQGLRGGARDSDIVADALKELAARAVDPAMKEGFEAVGFSWDDLSQRIAKGGPEAAAALDETLDKIRAMPDPTQQAAAAVALFGTQSEDMAAALLSMDLSTAVEELNGVEGAAQRMFDTLASNDASKIEQAQRGIETAVTGIQGALASVFADPLGDFADWVSANRGPLLQFFSDLAVGAIDFAITASDATGDFVSGPLADMVETFVAFLKITNFDPFKDWTEIDNLVAGLKDFDGVTDDVSDTLRGMKSELTDFTDPLIALGYVNDAALRTADAVSQVGVAATEGRNMLSDLTIAADGTAIATGELKAQLDASAQALLTEYDAAIAAGESQANLRGRYDATSDALMGQLTAMGLTQEQAQALIDTVLQTPEEASTVYTSNADAETGKVIDLGNRIITLPDGSTTITADTSPAHQLIDQLITTSNGKIVRIRVFADGSGFKLPGGQVVTGYASGGAIHGPGGPKDDMVPILASNGEHMLTAAEVTALGGHSGAYKVRSLAASGDLRRILRLADGGPVRVPASSWSTQPRDARIRAGVTGQPMVATTTPVAGPTVQAVFTGPMYSYDPEDVGRAARDKLSQLLAALPSV